MKTQFLSDLCTRKTGKNEWELTTPLLYRSKLLGRKIIVPVGFKTDFASVPRLPLVYLAFGGIGDKAAVVHDYLYHSAFDRDLADAILKEALIVCNVPLWKAWMMWAGVRCFGGRRYSQK